MALVAYSDSEDEEGRPSTLPPLDFPTEGSKNEWLSHVYIPGTFLC